MTNLNLVGGYTAGDASWALPKDVLPRLKAAGMPVWLADPAAAGWTSWYVIVPHGAGRKTLIGSVGAGGPPDESGAIMIGYSLLDQFHGKGYATAALQGFLAWAGRHPGLRRVVADTYPHLKASIRVLEKCGFGRVGAGLDEGTIRFELWCL